jgi:hypothetical protein
LAPRTWEENDVKFCAIGQRPGDVVITGPGCVHYVIRPVSFFINFQHYYH